jgi:hypothetical protein
MSFRNFTKTIIAFISLKLLKLVYCNLCFIIVIVECSLQNIIIEGYLKNFKHGNNLCE